MSLLNPSLQSISGADQLMQWRLKELQQEARIGWEARMQGEVVDGEEAMVLIRANLRSRYGA